MSSTDPKHDDEGAMIDSFGRESDGESHFGIGAVILRAALGVMVLTAAFSLLGVIGGFVVVDQPWGDSEVQFVRWISENRIPALDSVATVGSTLSDTWTVIGVVVGSVWMLWVTEKRRFALLIVLAVVIELATFFSVGAIMDRPRPDVEALHSVPTTPSYPSGHTAIAFALYGALVVATRSMSLRPIPRLLWLVPATVALVVAAARVYEGVHHPTDVLAGLLLGAGALAVAVEATGCCRSHHDTMPFESSKTRAGPNEDRSIGRDGRRSQSKEPTV